jgi:uncharacterized protein (TIGR02301 family)
MRAGSAVGFALALAMPAPLPAVAQPTRTPDERQVLLELAFVLGEAHALRAACRGAEDQAWRARMSSLIEVEKPDEPFRRLLVERFNAGYAARQAEAADCKPGVPAQERAAAVRGRALALRLGGG